MRYMQCYEVVKERIPAYALQAAAARGVDLVGYQPKRPFGPYTEAVKRMPVPEVSAVEDWLDRLEAARKTQEARRGVSAGRVDLDPSERMRDAYRSIVAQYGWVCRAAGVAEGGRWARSLLGMLLTEFHLAPKAVTQLPVADGFRAVVGRPRKVVKTVDVPKVKRRHP